MIKPSMEITPVGTVALIYSEPGVGKSTVLAQGVKEAGERGLWISVVEDGLSPLQKSTDLFDLTKVNKMPKPVTKWDYDPEADEKCKDKDNTMPGLLQVLRYVCTNIADYDIVAIDSLNLIMENLEEYCFQLYFMNNPEYAGMTDAVKKTMAYGYGSSRLITHMGNEWSKLLVALRYLKEKNVTVLLSNHRMVKKVKMVDQDTDYNSYSPNYPFTNKVDLGEMLVAESDLVLYGKFDIIVAKKDGGKTKAMGGTERVFVTTNTPTVVAKKRVKLADTIPLTWKSLKKAL